MNVAGIVSLITPAFFVCGLVFALWAVWKGRTTQGAIAWAVGLISMPVIAVPLYLVFGSRKFYGYVAARRVAKAVARQNAPSSPAWLPDTETFSRRTLGDIKVVEALADTPFTRANETKLLIDGRATFEAIFKAIDAAKVYVLVEYYTVEDDDIGGRLRDRLKAAVGRGVRVYFLYDEIGSTGTRSAYFDGLREAGIVVHPFGSATGFGKRFQLNFRNHRKIVVVDGRVAFTGGINVGDDYLGLNGKWRDTHLQMRGPVVLGAQLAFDEDWFWATGGRVELDWTVRPCQEADKMALFLATGPADRFESCSLFVVQALNAALERVWIATPYFVPDLDVTAALQLAVLRGVDVRIIVPDKNDNFLVGLAHYAYVDEAAKGIRFYRYTDGFMHQKVMLIDHEAAVVGTANMDNRSFRLNFEVSVIVADRGFAAEIEAMLDDDFKRSRVFDRSEYDESTLLFKLAVKLARLTSPLL